MGYRIEYGPQRRKIQKNDSALSLRMMTAVFLLCTCILTRLIWPEGVQLLRELLLPGEMTAVETAFLELMQDFRSCEPTGESIVSFCRSVIENVS